MRFIKVLLLLLLFFFGLLFFVQNTDALSSPLKLKLDLFYTYTGDTFSSGKTPATVAPPAQDATTQGAASAPAKSAGNRLYWESSGVPFYFVVLVAFAMGMIFATSYFFLDRIRLSYLIISKKRTIRTLQKEINRMKAAGAKEVVIDTKAAKPLETDPQNPVKKLAATADPVCKAG